MFRQDKWTSLNLMCKFHYHVLITNWYNRLFSIFLKSFMKESYARKKALEMWKSWFDFRPLHLGCEWEVYTHMLVYTYIHVHICLHIEDIFTYLFMCICVCVYLIMLNNRKKIPFAAYVICEVAIILRIVLKYVCLVWY